MLRDDARQEEAARAAELEHLRVSEGGVAVEGATADVVADARGLGGAQAVQRLPRAEDAVPGRNRLSQPGGSSG